MITTLAPLLLDGSAALAAATAAAAADHLTYSAAPLWDIGANLQSQGIGLAVKLMIAGTALVAAFQYFVAANKTNALRTAVIGIALMGVIASLPALGIVSRDTVTGAVNSGGYR